MSDKKPRRVGIGTFRSADGKTINERTNARSLTVDGVVYTRVAKQKPKSRATRLFEVVGHLNSVAEDIRNACEGETVEDIRSAAQTAIDRMDFSEVESLKDEMESWRDNMDGANMTHLEKYDQVSEACDGLDSMYNACDSISTEISDTEDIEELRSELESLADEIENAACEGYTIEFPGMFG